jgi:hypothetical protein
MSPISPTYILDKPLTDVPRYSASTGMFASARTHFHTRYALCSLPGFQVPVACDECTCVTVIFISGAYADTSDQTHFSAAWLVSTVMSGGESPLNVMQVSHW